ncbi:MAG: sugar ABC transporter permease [Clostridiales bacterium]|nr:sugar ABC transporter permease [Clostridiales bacterium]
MDIKAKAPAKRRLSLQKKQNLVGWAFLLPAALLIVWMCFYPMLKALLLSFQSGQGARLSFAGLKNYAFLLKDSVFQQALKNNFIYLLIQVPIMLMLALMLAALLNNRKLKLRGLYRTAIFLPCATSLVSVSLIFRSMFAVGGFVNVTLMRLGMIQNDINWINGSGETARAVIIIALIWRWTGYNMVFYLSGLQNIDSTLYEAAYIDGANPLQQFRRITVPLLRPTILLTVILSTNGTLQLFDESFNLTRGGPSNLSITMSHYIYRTSFENVPKFGYAAAMSYVVFILVAVLALVQMRVGDKR